MNKLLDLDIQRFATSVDPYDESYVSVNSYTKTFTVSNNKVTAIRYQLDAALNDFTETGTNKFDYTATSNNARVSKTVSGRQGGAGVSATYYLNVAEIGAAKTSTPIIDYICLHSVSGVEITVGYHVDWKSIQDTYNYQVDLVLENQTNGETYYETVWPYEQYQDIAKVNCPVGNSTYKAHFRIIDNTTNTLIGDWTGNYIEFSVTHGNPSLTINNRKLNSDCSEVNYQCTLNIDAELRLDAITGYLYLWDTSVSPWTKTVVKQLSFGQSQVQNMCINGLTAGNTYEVSLSISAYDPQTYDYYYGTFSNQFDAQHNNAECSGIRVVPHSTTADCYVNNLRCYNGESISKIDFHFSNYDDPNNPVELTFTSTTSDKFRVTGLTANTSYFVYCDIYNSGDQWPMTTYLPNNISTQVAGNDLPFAVSVSTVPRGSKVSVTLQNNNYKVATIMNNGYINHLIGTSARAEGWGAESESVVSRVFLHAINYGNPSLYEEFFCQNKTTGTQTSFLVDYIMDFSGPDLVDAFSSSFALSSPDESWYILTYENIENYRAQQQYTVGSVIVTFALREGVYISNAYGGPMGSTFYEGSKTATREFTSNGTYTIDIPARINGVDTMSTVTVVIDKIGQVLTANDFDSVSIVDSSYQHKGMYLRPKSDNNTYTTDFLTNISSYERCELLFEVLGVDTLTNISGGSATIVSGQTNTIKITADSNTSFDFTITGTKDGKTVSHTYTAVIYCIGAAPCGPLVSILYSEYDKDTNYVNLFATGYPINYSHNPILSSVIIGASEFKNIIDKIKFRKNGTELQSFMNYDPALMTSYASISKDNISTSDTFTIYALSRLSSNLSDARTDDLATLGYSAHPDLTTNYYPGANTSPLHLILPDGTVVNDASFIKPDGTKADLADVIKIIKT